MFTNLLVNAIKYRASDRPCLIGVRGRSETGRSIYEVHDNGIGIEPDVLDRIFEIFHRLPNAKVEGEGLGLTIARRVLTRLGGSIRVESRIGGGTAIRVRLPGAQATA